MGMLVTAGSTNVTTYFHLRLAADGTDATGLTITNIDLQYVRSGAAASTKADATALAAADSAHTDNAAIEVDATDQPGVYRVDWPDAAFAAGVNEVILTVKVATAFTESLRVRLMSATRGLAGTALPDAAADGAGGLPISDAGGLDLDTQIGTDIDAILVDTGTTLQNELDGIQADTEDIQSRLPAALTGDGNIKADTLRIGGTLQTANDVGADVDAILVDTAEIGAAGAGLTNINLPDQAMNITGNITGNLSGSVGSVTGAVGSVTGNVSGNVTGSIGSLATQAKADVNAEMDTALTDIHLDHLLAAEYDPASKPGDAGALLNELVESDDSSPDRARFTATALEQGPGGGSAPTAAEIADAVWEEALADHEGTAGSTAEALADAGGSGASAADIADAVLDEALSGHTTAGSLGKAISDTLADTNELQGDWVNGGRLDLILDARSSQTSVDDLPTNSELTTALSGADDAVLAAVAALNNLSEADVRTAIGLASANLDTQLGDLPTNAELTTALGSADDAVLAAVAALNDLDAAGIRTAVGLASANLDTQLTTIDGNVDAILADTGTDGVVVASASKTGYALSATGIDGVLDEAIGDSTVTMRQALKAILAVSVGKLSGAATTTITIRNVADDTDVVIATSDEDGNRSAVTLDL